MEPIIPVWMIYLAGVADAIIAAIIILGFLTLFTQFIFCCFDAYYAWRSVDRYKEWKEMSPKIFKWARSMAIVAITMGLLTSFIPSTKTCYMMIVNGALTKNNIEAVGDGVKGTIDYIADAIDKITDSDTATVEEKNK